MQPGERSRTDQSSSRSSSWGQVGSERGTHPQARSQPGPHQNLRQRALLHRRAYPDLNRSGDADLVLLPSTTNHSDAHSVAALSLRSTKGRFSAPKTPGGHRRLEFVHFCTTCQGWPCHLDVARASSPWYAGGDTGAWSLYISARHAKDGHATWMWHGLPAPGTPVGTPALQVHFGDRTRFRTTVRLRPRITPESLRN